MEIAFFDIDGVLADCSHRLHYLENKDYDNGEEAMMNDNIINEGFDLLFNLKEWCEIVLVTGRPERTREITSKWFKKNWSNKMYPLLMRKDGDYRPSGIVKKELIEKFLKDLAKDNIENCAFFIDDDPENCKALDGETYYGIKITSLLFGAKRLEKND